MAERAPVIACFLADRGWDGARRSALAGDASFRRYERLSLNGRRCVLMDAPPPEEDVRRFVRLARHLRRLDYSAPEIYAEDAANGLLLIEDLGDDCFAGLLADDGDRHGLYALAVDLLIDLHGRPESQAVPAGVPAYDDDRLLEEAFLLTDWYMPAMLGRPTPEDVRGAYREAWRAVFPAVRGQAPTLVLRDYFAENLMWLPDREGVAACGLLDFQDAVRGPGAYDLVSLLEDERRDIDPGMVCDLLGRYHAAFPDLDREAFAAAYAVLGAQRHAKNIGIFTRLCVRDGKPWYLDHIPRMWGLLEGSLRHPGLAGVADWLDRHVPPPSRGIPPCRKEAP